jgi:uncharacterized DUF497 family protein
MEYHWNDDKDAELQEQRNVSFHTIEQEIRAGKAVDIIEHPSRPNQMILLLDRGDHIWAVPFVVQDEENVFLKTAYPSRKYTRRYGGTE